MNDYLRLIKSKVFDNCSLTITNYQEEIESKEYDACSFIINNLKVRSRSSKITPKKTGQFVTFWKRNNNGPIEPFEEVDTIDLFIVNVVAGDKMGQFVFPKSILIKKGIISTSKKEGKRAFRIYPIWDVVVSKQAQKTQSWQEEFFFEVNESLNFNKVKELYKN